MSDFSELENKYKDLVMILKQQEERHTNQGDYQLTVLSKSKSQNIKPTL